MRIANIFLSASLLLAGTSAPTYAQSGRTLPHTIIYKTRADYSRCLAVELSTDKKSIASYPATTDVQPELKPVKLKKGYWLSKTGVSPNTAFLTISTEDYSKLRKMPPSSKDLYLLIRDKSPMTEMWDCGVKDELTVAQINTLISRKRLGSKCKEMKLR